MQARYLFTLFLIFGLYVPTTLHADPEKLTEEDWQRISKQRKIYYVLQTMESFNGRGVVFSHSASDYIDSLDRLVIKDSKLKNQDMERIFETAVSQNEPVSKKKSGVG